MAKKQPDPATVFTQRLIERLEALRHNDPDGYMPPLRSLIEQAGEPPDEATVKKALGRKQLKDRVFLVNPKDLDSPVAFQEDVEKLADSPRLLDYLKRVTPQRYLDIIRRLDIRK